MSAPLQRALNEVNGVFDPHLYRDATAAANIFAGTSGRDLVAALNVKAGNAIGEFKDLAGVLNQIVGSSLELDVDGAAELLM